MDISYQLGKARYLSCFDLAFGFHQIPMDPQDSMKTAFSSLNGHYEYKKMSYGLKKCCPCNILTLINAYKQCLNGFTKNICFVYLDDI